MNEGHDSASNASVNWSPMRLGFSTPQLTVVRSSTVFTTHTLSLPGSTGSRSRQLRQ